MVDASLMLPLSRQPGQAPSPGGPDQGQRCPKKYGPSQLLVPFRVSSGGSLFVYIPLWQLNVIFALGGQGGARSVMAGRSTCVEPIVDFRARDADKIDVSK